MRTKGFLDEDIVIKYKDSIEEMRIESEIKKMEIIDFDAEYRPEEDRSSFFVKTKVPIPSCIVNDILIEEETGDPIFEYKITAKGTIDKDVKGLHDFIENGAVGKFSFYRDVFELKIFQDKKDKKYDTFNISFESMSELYEILSIQRSCDYKYRDYWINKNFKKIIKEIEIHNKKIETSINLEKELKIKSKTNSSESFFRSLDKNLSIVEAKKELFSLKKEIKNERKNLLYPSLSNFDLIKKGIDKKSVTKVVSYFKLDGEIFFYFFK